VKKFSKIKVSLRVDPITDEYTLIIPESFCNELDWYEGTNIMMSLDGDGVYLEENND
tara:strand:- start:13178 stop:13348 length:171 start_codon:yes stop_codon:yes gene_type:complete